MKKSKIIPLVLAVTSITACSKAEETTPYVYVPDTTVNTPVFDFSAPSDVTSSATTIAGDNGYVGLFYEALYKNTDTSEHMLSNGLTADQLVAMGLAVPYVLDSSVPVEIIHQAVYEALGTAYSDFIADYTEGQTVAQFAAGDHYGLTHSSVLSSTPDESAGELSITGGLTAKTARLFLPRNDSTEYLVLTIQEIIMDENNVYTAIELDAQADTPLTDDIALEFLQKNVETLNTRYLLNLSTPIFGIDDGLEFDELSSATPETHTVETYDPSGNVVTYTLPHFFDKVVYLDYSAFDVAMTMETAGYCEQMVIQDNMPTALKAGLTGTEANLSTSVNAGDVSSIAAFAPDVIYLGKEYAHLYSQLTAIAPVIMVDGGTNSSYNTRLENIYNMSKPYMLEYTIDAAISGLADRLSALKATANGKTVLVVSVSNGVLTPVTEGVDILSVDLGMTNIGATVGELNGNTLGDVVADYILVIHNDQSMPASSATYQSVNTAAWTQQSAGVSGIIQMITDLENGL